VGRWIKEEDIEQMQKNGVRTYRSWCPTNEKRNGKK
jgi:hypothetical protein